MNKRFLLTSFLVLLYAGSIAIYWLKLGFTNDLIREGFYLSAPLLAIIAGVFALYKFGFSGRRSRTLLLLTAGVMYWFFGEVFFDYYQFVTHVDTSPSAADIFYVFGYPFLLGGLINEIRVTKVNLKNLQKPTRLLISTIALVLTCVISYFGIYKAYDASMPSFANLISLSYGVGDLLLILTNIFLLILAWEFRGGKLFRVWLTMCLGMALFLIADMLFGFYSEVYNNQVWFYKSLLDSLWIGAYLLFASAFFEFSFSLEDAYKKMLNHVKEKSKN